MARSPRIDPRALPRESQPRHHPNPFALRLRLRSSSEGARAETAPRAAADEAVVATTEGLRGERITEANPNLIVPWIETADGTVALEGVSPLGFEPLSALAVRQSAQTGTIEVVDVSKDGRLVGAFGPVALDAPYVVRAGCSSESPLVDVSTALVAAFGCTSPTRAEDNFVAVGYEGVAPTAVGETALVTLKVFDEVKSWSTGMNVRSADLHCDLPGCRVQGRERLAVTSNTAGIARIASTVTFDTVTKIVVRRALDVSAVGSVFAMVPGDVQVWTASLGDDRAPLLGGVLGIDVTHSDDVECYYYADINTLYAHANDPSTLRCHFATGSSPTSRPSSRRRCRASRQRPRGSPAKAAPIAARFTSASSPTTERSRSEALSSFAPAIKPSILRSPERAASCWRTPCA